MALVIYLTFAILLLIFAWFVFQRIVRVDYRQRGRLGPVASLLQLIVFAGYFSFPYTFNPAEWAWFWRVNRSIPAVIHWAGFGIICLGFIVAFVTMAWFGIGKAFGLKVESITKLGPYKRSRNPQVLGGYLLVFGTVLQRPSFYALGWLVMYGIISHWMVMSEEEHLQRVFGEDYQRYCSEVPRYL